MNQFDHNEIPALPPDLHRLDQLLAQAASREQIPSGLSGRVYDASVSDLPKPRLRLRGRALTTSTSTAHRNVRIHRTAWGQLAMAASLALAFVVGAMFWGDPSGIPDIRGFAVNDRAAEVTVTPVAYEQPGRLSREAERELFVSSASGDRFAYLFETRDMTHSEILGDLTSLLDDLEL